jgi:CMP-N-acetylneuraminic acid synthetase
MRILGIIPARAGSIRLPGKNLAIVGGKPMIRWTVDAVMNSALDRWLVSTDDHNVVTLCEINGWPYRVRPADLHGDKPIEAVTEHHAATERADAIMLLQPTSPLRTADDIDAVLAMLPDYDSVASYVDIGKHQELLTTNGAIFACQREYANTRLLRGPRHGCYLMPACRSVDVDDASQAHLAGLLLTHPPAKV